MVNQFARRLRNNATEAERALWQHLRLLKKENRHFRRQVPIGRYIVDFACHYPRLVVELDGGQHSELQQYDTERSRELLSQGYKVLRFWNFEVFENAVGVVDRIRHEVGLPTTYSYDHLTQSQTPTPNPSPQGGGGLDRTSKTNG